MRNTECILLPPNAFIRRFCCENGRVADLRGNPAIRF
jgi:hypothetical protein